MRITHAMRSLMSALGIDVDSATLPNLGNESDTGAVSGSAFAQINDLQTKVGLPADTASATGSAFAQINQAQVDIGATADTASASGSLFARAKYNKDANDAVAARALVLETALLDVQTITLDAVIPTDAVIVAGTAFTAVASGATGDQFNVGVDDAATAANLAAKITALSGVSATSDDAVVTVTSDAVGVGVFIASADTTMVVASLTAANVMGLIHGLLAEIATLDARVTAIEGA